MRDGFLAGLEPEVTRRTHDAARTGLEGRLGSQPGHNPTNAVTLDLLEEVVYHALASGSVNAAWEIYERQIGGFHNLLWRLADYERGRRICRMFLRQQDNQQLAAHNRLSHSRESRLLNDLGRYLQALGILDKAAECFRRMAALGKESANLNHASLGAGNVAHIHLLQGRIQEGFIEGYQSLEYAQRNDHDTNQCYGFARLGHAHALTGNIKEARRCFAHALIYQHRAGQKHKRRERRLILYRSRGIDYAYFLLRIGKDIKALKLTEKYITLLNREFGDQHQYIPKCNIILSEIYHNNSDKVRALELLDKVYEWTISRNSQEVICIVAILHS